MDIAWRSRLAKGHLDRTIPKTRVRKLHRPDSQDWVRYLSHAFIAFLVLVLAFTINPSSSIIAGQIVESTETSQITTASFTSETQTGFLTAAAVPSTELSIRSILPVVSAERQVRNSVIEYTVQAHDTVLGIADKFGLDANTILWSNDELEDTPDLLQIGDVLYILPVDGAYHTVASGDTLESIAKKYQVETEAITSFEENGLTEPYELTVGQRLIVPGGIKPYTPRAVIATASSAPSSAVKGSGVISWPMSGYISQGYWAGHLAIDIAASAGTPIYAADAGYVVAAGWSTVGYGNMVIIDHGNGYRTLYAHMTSYWVQVGQSVAKGQQIGTCGSTGNSTGPHLHFEVIVNGVQRNPLVYLP